MQNLVTSEQIKTLEFKVIEKEGVKSSLKLMEKAGVGLTQVLKAYKEPYLFICGKGNNGGDGITACRYLIEASKKVFLFLISDPSELSDESKHNFEKIKDRVQYSKILDTNDENFKQALSFANTIIDCLLGTGANNKQSDLFNWIINQVNDSNKPIIACDLPTGLNPDNGNVQEITIKAKETVTFGYTKIGLLIYPGKKYVGTIKTIDIGLPRINTNCFLLDDDFLRSNFPKRDEEDTKNKYGRTLLICGSKRYPGAALLASKACASIGSGLTILASPEVVFSKISPVIPEVIQVEFKSKKILKESTKSTVLVVGPGLTTEKEIAKLVETIVTKVDVPIVLDADGINIVAKNKEILKKIKGEIILTPHHKEFARLLNIKVEEVLENKLELIKTTAVKLNCTVVLKGPGTIIATKDGKVFISPFANSALAKGGTGDVLSGFIGGLIAQGVKPYLAACVGVYMHGKIAELIKSDKTVYSLLPQDLIAYLPTAIQCFLIKE